MPIAYANPDTQRFHPTTESGLPDAVTDLHSPISPRSMDAGARSFLGFTPPQVQDQHSHLHRSHLIRMRKGKSRKAAVRGLGADGGTG